MRYYVLYANRQKGTVFLTFECASFLTEEMELSVLYCCMPWHCLPWVDYTELGKMIQFGEVKHVKFRTIGAIRERTQVAKGCLILCERQLDQQYLTSLANPYGADSRTNFYILACCMCKLRRFLVFLSRRVSIRSPLQLVTRSVLCANVGTSCTRTNMSQNVNT